MNGNLAYQDDVRRKQRKQLINGKVVMMAPAAGCHVNISGRIFYNFYKHLEGKKCHPFIDGYLVHLTEKDRFVPDMTVVCDPNKIKPTYIDGAPDLVVEVLSPSTAKYDRGYKKDIYESCGVPEYWIVDPVNRSIEIYTLAEGRYVVDGFYTLCDPEELAEMTDNDKARVISEFKCQRFDGPVIRLEEIFRDL